MADGSGEVDPSLRSAYGLPPRGIDLKSSAAKRWGDW